MAAAESGELNTFTHVWVYESAADRETKRAKMAQDPDWKTFLAENAKAGNVSGFGSGGTITVTLYVDNAATALLATGDSGAGTSGERVATKPRMVLRAVRRGSPRAGDVEYLHLGRQRRRSGGEGARVFEVEKSVDTKKVNAYVTGVGKTKRIVLWDTLLARLTPRQTKFVVGHELGHYVLGHVWINIVISSALTVAGLYGVHRTADGLIAAFGDRFGFDRISDVASMPLLMLLLSLFAMLITPAMLALSRHHERAATRSASSAARASATGETVGAS